MPYINSLKQWSDSLWCWSPWQGTWAGCTPQTSKDYGSESSSSSWSAQWQHRSDTDDPERPFRWCWLAPPPARTQLVKVKITNAPKALKGGNTRYNTCTVSFIWIWFILILKSLCLKSSLQENLSPSSTSLLFGILVRTRAFPQASDCRVRRSSLSSVRQQTHRRPLDQWCCILNISPPVFLGSSAADQTLIWSYRPIPVASLISSRVNSSPSLNISSTSVWKSDTCSSFLPLCRKKKSFIHCVSKTPQSSQKMSSLPL